MINPMLPINMYPAPQMELDRELVESIAEGWALRYAEGNMEEAIILAGVFHDLLLGRYDS